MQKPGIRIAAFDDGPFEKRSGSTIVIGVIGREHFIEGILSFRVKIDGNDSTEKLVSAIKNSKFSQQVKVVVLNGITFAGLNVIDVTELHKLTGLPTIAITRKKPHPKLLKNAIKKSEIDAEEKIKIVREIEKNTKIIKAKKFYMQTLGINKEDALKIADNAFELLRIAHLVASGVTLGISKGRI